MYFWRIFLWENGQKSTEYTNYTVAPIFIEDRLDETLDTGEIILKSMPISSKTAFPPKTTKFRLERYVKEDFSDTPKTWDFVVEHDDVEEYEGCPEICTHRIHLIEPSVIAQGMHVDNIALTYELQDVDLNYKVVKNDTTVVGELYGKMNGKNQTAAKVDYMDADSSYNEYISIATCDGMFSNAYKYEWDVGSLSGDQGIKNIAINHHAVNSSQITFVIPKLYIYGSKNNSEWDAQPLFQLNTITRIFKILRYNGSVISKSAITFEDGGDCIFSGAKEIGNRNDSWCYCNGGTARLRKIKDIAYTTSNHANYESFKPLYETFPPIAVANADFQDSVTFLTDVLSVDELDAGYTLDYEIVCTADINFQDGCISYYKQVYDSYYSSSGMSWHERMSCITEKLDKEKASDIRVDTTIYCFDMSIGANTPFVRKGVKYSCYDLLRKALLTCDTYILDNSNTCLDELGVTADSNGDLVNVSSLDYPIIVSNSPDENWVSRLKTAKIYETILEQKNLWEVMLQIGYYLHAIPFLEFANDGTDRFVLKFKQLGGTQKNSNDSRKITVFNSCNLSEYFTQYDSYVTNLFSPQNLCEEWVTCKTSDSSYLVSNNTAEIRLKYSITEIVDFDIIYKGESKSALSHLFEKSIYEILTNADPSQISPAKGNSLYYTLGDNKIQGLSYIASDSGKEPNLMALKYIMQKLFGVNPSIWTQEYTFNNLCFRIKYRTQDSARITQFRPDLLNFLKNSSYEKYPHHEQYYGQQDKIIDSERFSANLFGKLIRVGNTVYQRQECARVGSEKESGDLVNINDEPYYVTVAENEYYADAILQKVTYSKNFNQISNIVTIPSEPRFYEVSERSKIRREVRMEEFFELSVKDTDNIVDKNKPILMSSALWRDFLKLLIFCKERTFQNNMQAIPNFAWTRFNADRLRKHTGTNSSYISYNDLFPSSDFMRTGENSISALESSDHADCIVPVLHFPLHDGIVFEWDMDDNFKAGDYIDKKVSGTGNTVDGAYLSQQSMRYVDIMGRADLFRFALFHKNDWTYEEAQCLPMAIIDMPQNNVIGIQGGENTAIALDKDNREEISFNYQINLLHTSSASGDDFITFPNLFGEKDNDLKVCLLNKEQSQFDENVSITSATLLADDVPIAFDISNRGSLMINFGDPVWIDNANLSDVKSIVFYHTNSDGGRTAYIVKNVAKLSDDDKLLSWFIYPVFNT